MYVLVLTEFNGRYRAGCFVAQSGSGASYTPALQKAKTYPTREAAQGDACGNEMAVSLEEATRR